MTERKTPNTDHVGPTLVTAENSGQTANSSPAISERSNRQLWFRRFWPLITSCVLSMIWIGLCLWWFVESGKTIARMPVYEAGGLLAGASLPLILVWLIALVYLRTDPLRDHQISLKRGLDELLTPLNVVQKRVNDIVGELHKQIGHVEVAGDVATTRIDNLENRFQEQISNLFEVTTDVEAKAITLQEKLSSERTAFSHLVTELTAQISDLEKNFTQLKFDSETITNSTRKNSEEIKAEISAQNEALNERSRLVGEQMGTISREMDNISQNISQNCDISENKLGHISQFLSIKQTELGKNLTELSDHTDQICDKMDAQAKNIAELSQETASQSEKITATLLEQTGELSTATTEALTQINTVSENLGDATEKSQLALDQAADSFKAKAAGIVQSSQVLADNLIGHMTRATDDLDAKTETLEHTIAVRASNMEDTLEKQTHVINEKLDQIVVVMDTQAKHIDETVKLTTDSLNDNTTKMHDHCQTFEQLTEKFHVQSTQSEVRLKTYHDNLASSLSDISAHLENALDNLKGQSTSLGEHSQQVINNIVDETEKLSENINDIRARTEGTIRNIQDMGKTVNSHFTTTDTQATVLSENWLKVADLVKDQCETTLSRLDELTIRLTELEKENTHVAETAGKNISKVSHDMQQASENIYLASASATEAADETNRMIDKHAEKFQQLINALQLSNKSILIDAEAIEQKNRDKSGSHFSTLASKIIEQLQSLSIDINRYFEDDVPDKIWQTYVDGDKNTFMRRLKKITDKKYTEIIREKYKSDAEFRKYALEYIQIFEDLIAQSMASDTYSTFSVALISSETGKVYLALAQAINRFSS